MTIGGMNVLTVNAEMGRETTVRVRLALALQLIDEIAPRVGVRLRRDVDAIVLWRSGGTAFSPATRAIVLDIGWSMMGTVEDLALSLVHEATHARQCAMGVPVWRRGLQGRLEAHAIAESIDFADALPPGLWTKPSLASVEIEWWTPEKKTARLQVAAEDAGMSPRGFRIMARVARLLGEFR